MNNKRKEIERFLKEEILGNPSIPSEELRALDNTLTKILGKSDRQMRDELRTFLERWEIRTLFVNALQEERDTQDKAKDKKR